MNEKMKSGIYIQTKNKILEFFEDIDRRGEKNISLSCIIQLYEVLSRSDFIWDEFSDLNNQGDLNFIGPRIFSDIFEKIYLQKKNLSKKKGAFFTPSNIASYLIECIFQFRGKIGKILDSKILDPSCGGGEFLIQAAQFLLNKTKSQKNYNKTETEELELRKSIVTDNLFGVDIDPIAIFITKLRLLFWIYMPKLSFHDKDFKSVMSEIVKLEGFLDKNLSCGDYLGIKDDNLVRFGLKIDSFDIIVGNPPFNVSIPKTTEKYVKNHFYKPIKNSAAYFLLMSRLRLKKFGIIGLILPKSLGFSRAWNTVKNIVLKDLLHVTDISKAFLGVKLEQIIIITGNDLINYHEFEVYKKNYYCERLSDISTRKESFMVPKEFSGKGDGTNPLLIDLSPEEYSLFNKIESRLSTRLGEFIFAKRGLNIQKKAILMNDQTTDSKNLIHCFGGADIKKFSLKTASRAINPETFNSKNKKDPETSFRIIGQLANAHVKNPEPHYKLAFFPLIGKNYKEFITFDTIINIFPKKNGKQIYYILGFLNSNLFAWYLYKIIYSGAIRSTRLDYIYLQNIPCINIENSDAPSESSDNYYDICILIGAIVRVLITLNQCNLSIRDGKNDEFELFLNDPDLNGIINYFDGFYNDLICILHLYKKSDLKKFKIENEIVNTIRNFSQFWDDNISYLLLNEIPLGKKEIKSSVLEVIKKFQPKIANLKKIIEKIENSDEIKSILHEMRNSVEHQLIRSPFKPENE